MLYGVSEGDTLQSIAVLHGSTVGSIVAFPGNEISDLDQLPVGLLLLVPGGRAPRETTATAVVRGDGQVPAPNVPAVGSLAGAAAALWLWPVDGRRITSSFGAAHPLGIDVGVPMRSRIFAANGGRVVFVGGDPCCSYGYYVDVDHGDRYRTRYAHVDEFLV
ncbi:MAG: M23 family metallopeptidase, partial [Chloroflexi bacterium]|nr:M23 family metallopeptidase [Chloroflexota bacterium]